MKAVVRGNYDDELSSRGVHELQQALDDEVDKFDAAVVVSNERSSKGGLRD